MKSRVEGLPVTVEAGGTLSMVFDRMDGDTAVYKVVTPEPEPEPDFTYLLVKVETGEGGEFARSALDGLRGVLEVTPHPGDCCCSNCPWDGSHSGPVGQRTWREC